MNATSLLRFPLTLSLAFLVSGSPGWAASEEAAFSGYVLPLLRGKCVSCHGEEKQKGKLRVDSLEALLKGGGEGPAVVPGKVEDSLMLVRIDLPKDDDERMPPEDCEQLTEGEILLLRRWVEKGAGPALRAGELGLEPAVLQQIRKTVQAPKPPGKQEKAAAMPAPAVSPSVREDVAKLANATGAHLSQVAADTPLLRFSALSVASRFGDKELSQLAPVAPDVLWMDLARTKVSNSGLAVLAQMKNLARLHLENTAVSDEGLVHLSGLTRLEYLNLYNTGVSDKGLVHLKGLKALKNLYLWQSKVTPAGAEELRRAVPGVVVNLGWSSPVTPSASDSPDSKPSPSTAKPQAAPTPAPLPNPPPVSKPQSAAAGPAQKLPPPPVAAPAPAVVPPAAGKASVPAETPKTQPASPKPPQQ